MTLSSSMTPAASASSWTSRAANRTPSSSKVSRSSRTSITAAPAAARSTPATAPASCMQMPHAFLKKVAKKDARINLPEPGLYAAGNIFMPRNATQRRKIEEVFARVVQAEGQVYLGARSVPTDNSMLGETAKAQRAVRAPGVHRPRAGDARRGGVRAQALRDPQARVQRDPRVDHRRRGVLVHRLAVAQDAGLQGHADHESARPVLPRPAEPADGDPRSRSCTRASPPTPSRAGTARIRTAASRTTARSTRCAATSTGCARARRCSSRRCSARTSRRSRPSSIRTVRTPRCSTTCSSSWCSPAARCRTPS